MGRGEPMKPSDLSEAERERLKRQYRGVFWDRKTKRWRCQLGYQSKKIFLGYFDDAGEAARAYDQKLVELRGAGARTNFPITEYLDMMPTPSKGRGGGGSGSGAAAVAAAAAAAAAANRGAMDADEEDEGEGEEYADQHEPGTAGGGYDAETPSLDPARRSSAAGGRITGLLDLQPNGSYNAAAGGGSESPRHGLANLPAIAPLSTELPGRQAHAALEQQDYNTAGEDELVAAAQLAIEIRRSFDGSSLKWQHQQHSYSGHPSVAQHSTGSGGGSAAAAAATGYAGRSSDQDVHAGTTQQQQQQSMGTYGNDTAAAAAAGYGGNASLYGSYGHHPHHHAAAAAHHHHQQQHYVQHHSHLRNGSTPGDLYGSSQGWADQAAAAAAAGAGYEGHPAYGSSSHYPHHHHHHHSHSDAAAAHGVQGGFSDSSGGYAGAYGAHHHAAHHAHYQQQQHARLQQQLMYQQQQQQAAGMYAGEGGEDQHMAAAAAGHLQHGQQQQHYHPHHQQQQQHGHYPLHHSHSYPGAAGHEVGMEGAAAAGYYSATRTYATHAEAVAAQQARLSHAHSSGHLPAHHSGGLVPAHGVYGSSGDLQQHYGGGLAAAQQQPGQHQQEYDARAAASNPAVAAADYRQRLATYGLHGYAVSDAGEYVGGAGMDAHMQQHYQHQAEQQRQQQHMHTDLAGGGPSAMDASGPGGADDQYHSQHAAAYETEDPWVQPRGVGGRGSAAGSEGGGLVDGMAGGEGLAAIKTSRGGSGSGRSSRAANRGGAAAAAAAAVDSDDYDIEDDDDHGSDSDTGRGRGRKSKRGSRASAAAGAHSNGDAVLRTKQRTGDGGEDERGHSYRGVFWDKKSRRWRCQLGHKNKKIFLGYFGVAEDAARAYDQKLVELHGNSAKTNFPIANYLGGGAGGAGKHGSAAAAAAESPRAPGATDVPRGRRRSSHAGDASAKASQAQHSELSWGALGLPRSARVSHDASEGAPRLSWAGADTLSSWDQQDLEALYASKRRRLMEGGGQLPTSPQEFGALTGSGLHGSHQAVGGEDMVSPTAMARQQSGGYRVVETPSVLPAGLTGRHSSSGHGSLPHPGAAGASGFEAAALAAGIVPEEQQQQQRTSLYAAPAGGHSTLSLSRLASGEVGAVQALSGLCTLGTHADSAAAAAAAGNSVPRLSGAAAANAVLAAAGASPVPALGAAATQQQQQSQASRLFDEAVNQYGARTSAPSGLPVSAGPLGVAALVASGRVSDANTGASSSTATPPSAINAGGHFGGHNNNTSPLQNATQAAALSRLNSSEVRAVQALSGIHNDVLPYNSRTGGYSAVAGFRRQQQQQAPSPASITETVAKELLCRASRVSAAAADSIAAVAAAAAAATAAKGSEGAAAAAAVACSSADGSFSGLVGDMAASLGDGRLPGAAAATPDALPAEQRVSTPRLSPLLTSTMLLPPPPPLQLQLEGHQELVGGDSLPGTASAAAAAAAAAVAAGKAAEAGAAAGAAKALTHLDPGDAFAAEAGWGNSGLEDLLMPKKRPSCSGNSGLIGLLGDIGQLKNEADAAAAAVVVPEQQQQLQEEGQAASAAAGDAAAAPAERPAQAAAQPQQEQAPAAAADAPPKAPAAAAGAQLVDAATAQPSVPAAALPAAVSAALPDPALDQSLSSAPVAFITPQAEPMAVQP